MFGLFLPYWNNPHWVVSTIIVNNVTVNMDVQVRVLGFVGFGVGVPGMEISGSNGTSVFNFVPSFSYV